MSLADEIKIEHRVAEFFDLAVANLVVDLALSFDEATQLLPSCVRTSSHPARKGKHQMTKLTSTEVAALLRFHLETFVDADRVLELAHELKVAQTREQAAKTPKAA